MTTRPLPRTTRRPLAWLLVGALLLAQTLGLAHRVSHSDPAAHAPETMAPHAPGHEHAGLLDRLFGHHEGAPDCPLFDHVASADTLPSAAQPTVLPAAQERLATVRATPTTRITEPVFLARAPPVGA
jgi:hypothetical protein